MSLVRKDCMSRNYLRFLALAQAIDLSAEFADVDEAAKQLLIYIALRHFQGKSITVTEAMGLKAIASPATIHRKLDVLLKVGLITKVFENNNRRTKYLQPTNIAEEYFAKLGELIQKVNSKN